MDPNLGLRQDWRIITTKPVHQGVTALVEAWPPVKRGQREPHGQRQERARLSRYCRRRSNEVAAPSSCHRFCLCSQIIFFWLFSRWQHIVWPRSRVRTLNSVQSSGRSFVHKISIHHIKVRMLFFPETSPWFVFNMNLVYLLNHVNMSPVKLIPKTDRMNMM